MATEAATKISEPRLPEGLPQISPKWLKLNPRCKLGMFLLSSLCKAVLGERSNHETWAR